MMLPSLRWALTPPFHPYLAVTGRFVFCCAVCPRLRVPGITRHHALRSPDFPPNPKVKRQPGSSIDIIPKTLKIDKWEEEEFFTTNLTNQHEQIRFLIKNTKNNINIGNLNFIFFNFQSALIFMNNDKI
jgi:hypothetical protein